MTQRHFLRAGLWWGRFEWAPIKPDHIPFHALHLIHLDHPPHGFADHAWVNQFYVSDGLIVFLATTNLDNTTAVQSILQGLMYNLHPDKIAMWCSNVTTLFQEAEVVCALKLCIAA